MINIIIITDLKGYINSWCLNLFNISTNIKH
jgi:hypothetical protein